MKVVLTLILAISIQLTAWPHGALAQRPCSFGSEFADLSVRAGDLLGTCVDEQRTLAGLELITVPGYGPIEGRPGSITQTTTRGLLIWDQQTGPPTFLDRSGMWWIADDGLRLVGWEAMGFPPAATALPAPQQAVAPPTPVRAAPPPPDPALMSRCVTLAGDMAEDLNQDLPPGSSAGGPAFQAFLGLCQIAVKQHGQRGFTCFETAFRRGLRTNRLVRPGSTSAIDAANAEYQLCVSAR
jgi:hypothetical protein